MSVTAGTAGTATANRTEIVVADRPIREVNEEIRAAVATGREVWVRDARSRHNLGVGLPAAARIEIDRYAGWGVGEAMARGEIVVGGYAGMAAGASMRGGVLHIRGDAGPRCGVAMKGGDIIVEGRSGMLEDEREASTTLVYQMTPSRYMLDLQHLRMADGIELAVGQGAKPGTGSVLLGMKVSERVARMRSLPVGVDQRSTVRHPDFLGADDLQVKVEELREATGYRVPIFVKMGATRPRYDVAIAAKSGADVIVLDGAEGGTGASPELLLDHTGIPIVSAIRAAREALDECGMSGEVSLVAAGGIRSGTDAAKCLALGADAVMIGTAALMALGCNSPRYLPDYEALGTSPGRCHHCHTGLCPVGITTQEPHLEERLHVPGASERVARFLTAMTMEITLLAKSCGKSSAHNLEVEDLRALSLEASAFTGVRLAGIDRPFTW